MRRGMHTHLSLNYSVDFLQKKYQVMKRDWKKTKAVNKLKKHKASEQARGGESSVQDSHGNS